MSLLGGNKTKQLDLDSIRADAEEVACDSQAKAEMEDFADKKESRMHRYVMHRLLEFAAVKEDKQREGLGRNISWLIIVWLFVVLTILVCDAWHIGGFDEPDGVMLMLLGTTTANIIGLFVIVLQYFYRTSALDIYFRESSKRQ